MSAHCTVGAHYGGTFDSISEAEAAAIDLRQSLHEEFAS